MRNLFRKTHRLWKIAAVTGGLCILGGILFRVAATAEEREKIAVTLKARDLEMLQDGELPKLEAEVVQNRVADHEAGITVQKLLDSLTAGRDYALHCEADGKTEGVFPVTVVLTEEFKKKLETEEWAENLEFNVKDASLTVKNKYGEWDGNRFKKWDGTYAANEFIVYGGDKYYLGSDGEKLTGEQKVGIKKYVFTEDGKYQSEKLLIDVNKPMIALTFDDGPGPGTDRILETLKKYNAKATFFMIGTNTDRYPDTIRKMRELGCELGNHSKTHPQLTKLSAEQIRKEMEYTNKSIEKATGGFRPTIMRPPFGLINAKVRENVGLPLQMWSVDTLDWKTRNTKKTVEAVMKAGDGDVVLMHDIHKQSVEAAVQLIPKLIDKGYQLVTVSELAEARGVKLEKGQKYSQFYKKKK